MAAEVAVASAGVSGKGIKPRFVCVGVNDDTGVWAFSADGGPLLELGEGIAVRTVRLMNTLALSDRKLRKNMIWDVGSRPRRGAVVRRTAWRMLAEGSVASINDAAALISLAVQNMRSAADEAEPPESAEQQRTPAAHHL